jgi:spore maturation protein CgeB
MKIAFFGSSVLSAYWNGAATYYRGLIRALHARGHSVTFYEPDAFDRQRHRDLKDPSWVNVVVYPNSSDAALRQVDSASDADLVIKTSGVGVFDELLEQAVLDLRRVSQIVAFWDVDAPATLDRVLNRPDDPFRKLIPQYDAILTYGGGQPVIRSYELLGARACYPIYNGLDPTTHYPVPAAREYWAHLSFLGNRLPDREARADEYFFQPAVACPDQRFLLAGNGWVDKQMPANVDYLGHLYTWAHNAFNCSPRIVLNISRDSMARNGYSPATRVFEAAGAGACLLSDAWDGMEDFFEPNTEILVTNNGLEVTEILRSVTPLHARAIGQAAYRRAIRNHTYHQRVRQLESALSLCAIP